MKNNLRSISIFILCVTASACATSSKINQVSIGMTKEEVTSVMGEPVSISATEGTEYMNYKLSETDDDAVRGWTTPYYVRLVNGKVDSYGRTGDFDSTKNPTVEIKTDQKITGGIDTESDDDSDLYTELQKLQELKEQGLLTAEEFEILKRRALEKY